MKKKLIQSALAFLLVFIFLFCGCFLFDDIDDTVVESVTVSPSTANVNKGATRQFNATVKGANSPAQTVTWSVNGVSGTNISTTGVLTVAFNETAATLTVRATSTVDTTKSGTAAVTVSQITTPVTPTDSRILNPAATNTQLSNNSFALVTSHGGGNKSLSGSPYGYETWDESGSPGTASFRWYGANQGGGAAFYATWTNVKDFLARVGFFWNENKSHADYGNIYCGFNFTRSDRYNGNFSYIGIYGWSRNPGASVTSERLIEYYIVEDSYGNQYRPSAGFMLNIGNETLGVSEVTPNYTLDGGTYKVFKVTRTGPSIAGNTTFTQFFSVRQTPRQNGTISISEHFRKWEERGMNLGTNMYECKFKVEAGGNEAASPGTGTFDARLIQFYRANDDGSIIQITP
jgi:endo-1,4-beta-xylanase